MLDRGHYLCLRGDLLILLPHSDDIGLAIRLSVYLADPVNLPADKVSCPPMQSMPAKVG